MTLSSKDRIGVAAKVGSVAFEGARSRGVSENKAASTATETAEQLLRNPGAVTDEEVVHIDPER